MEENLIVCPYDKNHVVRSSRFEFHLLKCQKNNSKIAVEICPFNAKHSIARNQIREHIASCPDKSRIAYEYSLSKVRNSVEPVVHSQANPFAEYEENWDNEIKRPVVIQPANPRVGFNDSYSKLKPSVRKQLRKEMVDEFKKCQEKENLE